MGGGFSKMKKQARALEEQFEQMRVDLKNKEVVGTSGNGLVTLTLDGERNLKKVQIKPECIDPQDVEGLQDLLVAAFQDAAAQLDKEQNTSSPFAGLPFSF